LGGGGGAIGAGLNCDPPGGMNCTWAEAASVANSDTANTPAIATGVMMKIRFMEAYVVMSLKGRKCGEFNIRFTIAGLNPCGEK
jgi:hypothetical protein